MTSDESSDWPVERFVDHPYNSTMGPVPAVAGLFLVALGSHGDLSPWWGLVPVGVQFLAMVLMRRR